MIQARHRRTRPLYPWIFWLLVALFYFFVYGVLVMPSVFSVELQSAFHTDRTGIGVLYSAFLYAYVLMQIPVGYIFDRYRSKIILGVAPLFVAMGCFLFVVSHTMGMGIVARMLMGFGGSFAFIGALYLGRNWFPVVMFPLIVGLTEAMSGLSELTLLPFFALVKKYQHWEMILLECAAIMLILSVFIFLWVRDRHPERKVKKTLLGSGFSHLIKNKVLWLICAYVMFVSAFDMVIAAMWGVPLLTTAYHIPVWVAAIESGMVMVGITLGCSIIGWIARFFSDRLLMLLFALLQCIAQVALLYLKLGLFGVGFIFFIIGFSSSAIVLGFDLAKKIIPESFYGLSAGFINMFFGMAGILISPLVGYVFQTTHNVNAALVPVVICSALALIIGVLLKGMPIKMLPAAEQGGGI